MANEENEAQNQARQRWMGAFARARPEELEAAWDRIAGKPPYGFLRRPETGLLMVQGRTGGDGRPFNFGEVTVTRCSVRLDGGHVGHAVVIGRSQRHAELAAALDALMQDGRVPELEQDVIAPLLRAQRQRRDEASRKAAATRVEFFTLARTVGA